MYNRIILIGRLTRDPELKYTPSGIAVSTFTVAVDRRFKRPDGERETDFIDVVAWKQRAEFAASYLSKGRLVVVEGSLQIRKWTQQDGTARKSAEVVADQINGLDRPREGGGREQSHDEAPPPHEDAPPDYAKDLAADIDDPFAEE
jgi:single-strand DNA-binding protein